MTVTDATRQRENFLARLDAAMQSVPHGVATEIRAGIVEELAGLDAAATAARIEQLGDPAMIAREAHVAAQEPGAPVLLETRLKTPATSTRGFAITAALVLSFGGIVVPAIGWVFGAVLVCASALWKTWEKTVAIVVPLAAAATVIVFGLGAWYAGPAEVSVSEVDSGFSDLGANNPLLPAAYDWIWMGIFGLGVLLVPASGLWLIWRLRRR